MDSAVRKLVSHRNQASWTSCRHDLRAVLSLAARRSLTRVTIGSVVSLDHAVASNNVLTSSGRETTRGF
ncbi:hypothetical protein RRG08_046812 [Elysia crispata]|uniref:Uncharacterized protein n=1 Tax=Elysia crispata TaxID=231223 RepID=A0AAE0ZNT2_9GAST|nr:hypothetical protein RRG08_046812 [Elysia crispata]